MRGDIRQVNKKVAAQQRPCPHCGKLPATKPVNDLWPGDKGFVHPQQDVIDELHRELGINHDNKQKTV